MESRLSDALRAEVDKLKVDLSSAKHGRGKDFRSVFTRARLLAAAFGRAGGTFAAQVDATEDEPAYARRLESARRANLAIGRNYDPIPGWQVDDLEGVIDAMEKAIGTVLVSSVEDLVASEIYADLLNEAESLLNGGHLPCAAILTRVDLEDGLRRVARRENMPDAGTAKANTINDWLWKDGQLYPKATHDAVMSWLAIGNAFAHNLPEREKYTPRDVARLIEDVRGFLGSVIA